MQEMLAFIKQQKKKNIAYIYMFLKRENPVKGEKGV